MKSRFVLIALLMIGASTLTMVSAARQGPGGRKIIIIRVTSGDPNEEQTFAASYLFRSKDSPLICIEQKTPFEVKEQSNFVSGIFRKKSGSGELQVRVTTISNGEQVEQDMAGGGGDIVIIGTQPERGHRIFAQGLSQQ